tara:strand:+ start:271 stop:726 length:456 start_codon:yes stop_codon:yes gene_type:complete
MSENIDEVVDDLISQLKSPSKIQKEITKTESIVDKENLEDFLLKYSGKLVKDSVEYVDDVKQFITSAPDYKDLEALSKLVGASASAIESLNKILISNKANDNRKEIKQMDIESKKELMNQNSNNVGLTINREELLNKLMKDAKIIDAEVTN